MSQPLENTESLYSMLALESVKSFKGRKQNYVDKGQERRLIEKHLN
jgi:hypothetical protein